MADEQLLFFFLAAQNSARETAISRNNLLKKQGKARYHRYVKRDSFNVICEELAPSIEKHYTNYRKAIPVRVRVAITLYRLGDTAHFRTISNLFGVGKSTVCSIVREVCQAIVDVLLLRYIQLPNSRQQIQEEIDGFKERAGFPQVVGSVDGCHIPILKPNDSLEDYVNRKKFHSIILQALVDSNYLFRDICVGWPGKVQGCSKIPHCLLRAATGPFTLKALLKLSQDKPYHH
ncbi:protein ALP1-like [Exaiptasia diaphana]|uniref:DDE Tnp4 domain-containing protein n=1 Tax=Exaiptasia diaphana TaxID=2652724 RepID=A0A913XI52_EXADI|nr:protein ALP1-like [Exaiptasia diaphana]